MTKPGTKLRPADYAAYCEYLRSPGWREVKDRYCASPRHPQTCVVCGSSRVQLHHRTYERVGRERLSDLVPLCAEHHLQAHAVRRKWSGDPKRERKQSASARQLAYIKRLGGTPPAEMTMRDARFMTRRLQKGLK